MMPYNVLYYFCVCSFTYNVFLPLCFQHARVAARVGYGRVTERHRAERKGAPGIPKVFQPNLFDVQAPELQTFISVFEHSFN